MKTAALQQNTNAMMMEKSLENILNTMQTERWQQKENIVEELNQEPGQLISKMVKLILKVITTMEKNLASGSNTTKKEKRLK